MYDDWSLHYQIAFERFYLYKFDAILRFVWVLKVLVRSVKVDILLLEVVTIFTKVCNLKHVALRS